MTYSAGHMSVMDSPQVLPYNGWFPYNYSRTNKLYWVTAVYQLYSVFSMSTIYLILDLLLPCIMCYMCGHIHILRYRFRVMTEKLKVMLENNNTQDEIIVAERKLMAEWVRYHIDILRFVIFL